MVDIKLVTYGDLGIKEYYEELASVINSETDNFTLGHSHYPHASLFRDSVTAGNYNGIPAILVSTSRVGFNAIANAGLEHGRHMSPKSLGVSGEIIHSEKEKERKQLKGLAAKISSDS